MDKSRVTVNDIVSILQEACGILGAINQMTPRAARQSIDNPPRRSHDAVLTLKVDEI